MKPMECGRSGNVGEGLIPKNSWANKPVPSPASWMLKISKDLRSPKIWQNYDIQGTQIPRCLHGAELSRWHGLWHNQERNFYYVKWLRRQHCLLRRLADLNPCVFLPVGCLQHVSHDNSWCFDHVPNTVLRALHILALLSLSTIQIPMSQVFFSDKESERQRVW